MIMQLNKIISFQCKNKTIMTNKTFSATLFFRPGTKKPRKYRNISNQKKFIEFSKKLDDIYYINWYDQKTAIFKYREWLKK